MSTDSHDPKNTRRSHSLLLGTRATTCSRRPRLEKVRAVVLARSHEAERGVGGLEGGVAEEGDDGGFSAEGALFAFVFLVVVLAIFVVTLVVIFVVIVIVIFFVVLPVLAAFFLLVVVVRILDQLAATLAGGAAAWRAVGVVEDEFGAAEDELGGGLSMPKLNVSGLLFDRDHVLQ